MFNLTKERYEYIQKRVDEFNKETHEIHFMQVEDVIYSMLYNDPNTPEKSFMVTNDWDEGEFNDPYWDKENNQHSTTTFLMQMVKETALWRIKDE